MQIEKISYPCSGIILAGGLNSRMGANKAFLAIRGKRTLDRLHGIFQELFDETILVTKEPLQYMMAWDLNIVTDLYPMGGALVGIHAGLFYASYPNIFVMACDLPFLKLGVVKILLEASEPRWDIVVPVTPDGHQPLCAVYSKRCMRYIEAQMKRGDLKVANFFPKVRVKKVPPSVLRVADPALVTFFNVNTQKDLAVATQINA